MLVLLQGYLQLSYYAVSWNLCGQKFGSLLFVKEIQLSANVQLKWAWLLADCMPTVYNHPLCGRPYKAACGDIFNEYNNASQFCTS